MTLLQYYNQETKVLALPGNFDEPLKGVPKDTKEIIFLNDHITPFSLKIRTVLK
jgi:hypothetical protein